MLSLQHHVPEKPGSSDDRIITTYSEEFKQCVLFRDNTGVCTCVCVDVQICMHAEARNYASFSKRAAISCSADWKFHHSLPKPFQSRDYRPPDLYISIAST